MSELLPSKQKVVVTAKLQRWTIGCMDVVSLLEMKILLTSVDNIAAPLRSNVEAIVVEVVPSL